MVNTTFPQWLGKPLLEPYTLPLDETIPNVAMLKIEDGRLAIWIRLVGPSQMVTRKRLQAIR